MKTDFGNPENGFAVLLDEFKFIPADFLKADNAFGRNFKIRSFAFEHEFVAAVSVSRSGQFKFG